MATRFRNPTSDIAETGSWTGAAAGTRYTLVDDHPDSGATDSLTLNTGGGTLMFGFAAANIPAGASITRVDVLYYDYKNGSGGNNIVGRLKVGGNYYAASTHVLGNGIANIALRVDQWTQNPKTTAAWTVDDVNGVGANALEEFGWTSSDSNPTIVVSSILLQIVYGPIEGTDAEQLETRDVQVAARSAEAVIAEKLEVRENLSATAPMRVQLSFAEVTMPTAGAAEPIEAERLEQLEVRDIPGVLTVQGVARAEQLEVRDLPTVQTIQGVTQPEQVEVRDLQSAARAVAVAEPEQLEIRDLTDAGWLAQATNAEQLEVRDVTEAQLVLGSAIAERLEVRDNVDATNPIRFVEVEERLEVRDLLDASTAGEPIAAERLEQLEVRDLVGGQLVLPGAQVEQLEVRDAAVATALQFVSVEERLEVRDLANAPTYVQLSFAEVTMPASAEELAQERLEVRDQTSATTIRPAAVAEQLEIWDIPEALLPTNVIVTWAQVTSPEYWDLTQEEKLELRDLPAASATRGAVQAEQLELLDVADPQTVLGVVVAERLEVRDRQSTGVEAEQLEQIEIRDLAQVFHVAGVARAEQIEVRDLQAADVQQQAAVAERLELRDSVSCVVLRVGSIAEQTAVRDDVATAMNIWEVFITEAVEVQDATDYDHDQPPPPIDTGMGGLGLGGSGGGRGAKEVFDQSGFFQRLERLIKLGVPLREAIKRAEEEDEEEEEKEPEDRPVMMSDFRKAMEGLSRDIEDLARLIIEDRD